MQSDDENVSEIIIVRGSLSYLPWPLHAVGAQFFSVSTIILSPNKPFIFVRSVLPSLLSISNHSHRAQKIMTSNEKKLKNYKVVDPIKCYNFYVKSIFI